MNVKKMQDAINTLHEEMGDGLLATDVWSTSDGQSLAGYNPQPRAVALFNRITENLVKSLKSSGFPSLGRYYLMELEGNKFVVVLPLGRFQWGILADSQKVKLGMLLNVAIPNALEVFEEAIKE